MSEKTHISTIFSAFFGQIIAADLAFMVIWLAGAIGAIYIPVLDATPARYVLALPIVLFIPGYCLIAALFPKKGDIDLIERVALSIGLSIAVVSLIGLGLNFTPSGIRLDPIVISLTVFTFVMILIAQYRRAHLPSGERFRVPFSAISGAFRTGIFPDGGSRVDRLLSVVLAVVMTGAFITTFYVITFPKEAERFSEFYVLGEQRLADDYPGLIIIGQNYPMFTGIGNHEYQKVTYTIEVWSLNMEFDNVTNVSSLMAMDPNDRLSLTLDHNETAIIPYNLSVKKTGYNRVDFLLFNDTVPSYEVVGTDRINASYRNLHLWVTVEKENTENANRDSG